MTNTSPANGFLKSGRLAETVDDIRDALSTFSLSSAKVLDSKILPSSSDHGGLVMSTAKNGKTIGIAEVSDSTIAHTFAYWVHLATAVGLTREQWR